MLKRFNQLAFFPWLGNLLVYLLSAVLTTLTPNLPFIIILLLVMVADVISAIRLHNRLYNIDQTKYHKPKIEAKKLLKMISSFGMMVFVILITHLVHEHIVTIEFNIVKVVAGIMIGCQILSVLENESTCNDQKWAKVLRKVLIDKANKYLKNNIGVDGDILDEDGKVINVKEVNKTE
jgi:hypothetical protein